MITSNTTQGIRDIRIDLIRGYAMITICINHVTWLLNEAFATNLSIPSLSYYGYSSAAEIFFYMSGYMVGMIYLGKNQTSLKLASRAKHLYLTNVGLLLTLIALSLMSGSQLFLKITYLDFFLESPIKSLLQYLTLSYTPLLTSLLFMYTLLLLLSIPFSKILNKSKLLFLFLTTSIYLISQIIPQIRLPNIASEDGLWSFNILAYQFLFLLGIYMGKERLMNKVFKLFEANKLLMFIPFILLVGSYGYMKIDPFNFNETWLDNKGGLGPLRILHFFIVLGCLMAGFVSTKFMMNSIIYKSIAIIGRQALTAFVVSVVCAYASLAIWIDSSRSITLYLTLAISSLAIMLISAFIVDKKKNGISPLAYLKLYR